MAWDRNVLLAGSESGGVITATTIRNNNGSYTNRAGSWITWVDQPSQAAVSALFTSSSGTFILGGNAFKVGLVEFRLWVSGITFTSAPTTADIDLWVEEADDNSATNVRPVVHWRLGSGAGTATPSGMQLRYSAASTVKKQFVAAGPVTKPWLRYNSTITMTGGASPDVTLNGVIIMGRGVGVTLEDAPVDSNLAP